MHSFPYVIPFDPQIGSYMRGHAHNDRPLGSAIGSAIGSGMAEASTVDDMIITIVMVTAKTTVI